MKKAVVVLTRGYNDINLYNDLINRNKSIELNLIDNTIDIIIFHEGNITLEHQLYIIDKTPKLKIIFIDVKIKNKAFLEDKKCLKIYSPTKNFKLGYRHMCSFWFVDFWDYVEEYNMILRIDEDCVIQFNITDAFNLLNDKLVCFGDWVGDDDFVTKHLNNFTIHFLNYNNIINYSKKPPSGPYTNVIGFNVKKLKENVTLQKYVEQVKYSNYIYIYRWGDLPLWGEVLYYLYDKNDYIKSNLIKYYHKSHNKYVNN